MRSDPQKRVTDFAYYAKSVTLGEKSAEKTAAAATSTLSLSLSLRQRKAVPGIRQCGDGEEEDVRLCASSYSLVQKAAAGGVGPKHRFARFFSPCSWVKAACRIVMWFYIGLEKNNFSFLGTHSKEFSKYMDVNNVL